MSALLLSSVKDEGPWLIEWVAFHDALNFNDILIYQNDSTDLTHEILSRLQALGVIHYKINTQATAVRSNGRKKRPQMDAFADAFQSDLYKRNDWCLVMDNDEYLNLKIHDNVDHFCAYHGGAHAVAINWRCFGSSGRALWSPLMTIDRFDHCAPEQHYTSRKFKSIHRTNVGFKAIGLHRPVPSGGPREQYVYSDGTHMPDALQINAGDSKWKHARGYHEYAQVNHYAVRSREEAERKMVRGRGTGKTSHVFEDYFQKFDLNHEKETSISRHANKAHRRFNELMDDPILRALHKDTCAIHFEIDQAAAAEVARARRAAA